MTELLSQSQFAAHRGVSRQTVTRWKRQGYIVSRDGAVDRDASDKLLDSRGTPGNGSAPNAPAPAPADAPADPTLDALSERLASGDWLTTAEAEQVKQNYLARLRQLEYGEKSERLVDVEIVADEVGKRLSFVRNRILALPNQAAPLVIGCELNETVQILADKVHETLEELSGPNAEDDGEDVAIEAVKNARNG